MPRRKDQATPAELKLISHPLERLEQRRKVTELIPIALAQLRVRRQEITHRNSEPQLPVLLDETELCAHLNPSALIKIADAHTQPRLCDESGD